VTNSDLILIIGAVLLCLSPPALLRSYADRELPRRAFFLFIGGVALILLAKAMSPEGYAISDIPQVLTRVIGHYF